MNPTHHAEQMEARRRDFELYWKGTMKPAMERMGLMDYQLIPIEHAAWKAFNRGVTISQSNQNSQPI